VHHLRRTITGQAPSPITWQFSERNPATHTGASMNTLRFGRLALAYRFWRQQIRSYQSAGS
jgi:hypothetical protein